MAHNIPEGIAADDIRAAVRELDLGTPHPFGDSTRYDLLYEGRRYPPKAILGLAAVRLTGKPLGPYDFKGGEESKCFRILRSLGFEVVPKIIAPIQCNAVIGTVYTWEEIQRRWNAEQTYLALKGGRIVCATLNRDQNPDAPEVMVVGHKKRNTERGELFCQQRGPIPVFVKEAIDEWHYHGMLEVESFTTDRAIVGGYESPKSGPLSRVIFLRAAPAQDELRPLPDIDVEAYVGREGRKKWVLHLRRERDPRLASQKRRAVLKETGKLVCEVCGFDFATFYEPHVFEFCEVHHRVPLADTSDEVATKLEDLAIVCANCHRAIHRIVPMPMVEELARTLAASRKS